MVSCSRYLFLSQDPEAPTRPNAQLHCNRLRRGLTNRVHQLTQSLMTTLLTKAVAMLPICRAQDIIQLLGGSCFSAICGGDHLPPEVSVEFLVLTFSQCTDAYKG